MAEVAEETKPTHISAVIDRSGSMQGMWTDTVGGFATFLDEQKELPGQAVFTLRVFDTEHDVLYENVNRDGATTIPDEVLPRGGTALLDAVGQQINSTRAFLSENEEYEQVVMIIMTDGHENSSSEFQLKDVRNLVRAAETDGWQFVFMGANVDAFGEAHNLGMQLSTNVQYDAANVDATYATASATASNLRRSGVQAAANIDVTKDEDDES